MSLLLKGAPVGAAITEKSIQRVNTLKEQGVEPTLAILRVGERPDDLSYERGAMKKAAVTGIQVQQVVLDAQVSSDDFFATLDHLNADPCIHGILMLRPLPKQIDEAEACRRLAPEKDVDGCGPLSLAGVFCNSSQGFAPCTAQAVMEVLNHYQIPVEGKNAVIIGRSLVVGRPLAMLLMHANATVTLCHTRTKAVSDVAQKADLLIGASGQMESIDARYVHPDQVVIDVGISWNERKQKLCGDVCFDEVESVVNAVTPVPGGIGAVTTAVLMAHVVQAAERAGS